MRQQRSLINIKRPMRYGRQKKVDSRYPPFIYLFSLSRCHNLLKFRRHFISTDVSVPRKNWKFECVSLRARRQSMCSFILHSRRESLAWDRLGATVAAAAVAGRGGASVFSESESALCYALLGGSCLSKATLVLLVRVYLLRTFCSGLFVRGYL